jgi:APA family basic amino acid/polyamine antiporter
MPAPSLARVLGLGHAVALGLGAMLGTGLFVGLAQAASCAPRGLFWALGLAAALALLNGLAVAQLAAAQPESGGTWAYARRHLGPGAGFIAGCLFLCAKSASCATAALALSASLLGLLGLPEDGPAASAAAAGLVLAVTALAAGGLTRSARVNTGLVTVTLGGLAVFIVAALAAGPAPLDRRLAPALALPEAAELGPFLHAAALCFVAFAGYARVATLGEEVATPARTIPRAIFLSLGLVAVVAVAVLLGALSLGGVDGLGRAGQTSGAPLAALASLGIPSGGPLGREVVTGALTLAALSALAGVMLNLVLGLSRVAFAMGRGGDLPAVLGRARARRSGLGQTSQTLDDSSGNLPRTAIQCVGIVVAGIALCGGVQTTWAFSALSVLGYYALTHLAAWRQPTSERRLGRAWNALGLVACLGLAAFIPATLWAGALALMLGALALRRLRR